MSAMVGHGGGRHSSRCYQWFGLLLLEVLVVFIGMLFVFVWLLVAVTCLGFGGEGFQLKKKKKIQFSPPILDLVQWI